jgi:hypothetical protein
VDTCIIGPNMWALDIRLRRNRPAVEHFNLTCQSRLEFSRIATGLYHTEVRIAVRVQTWRRSVLRAGLKAWQVPGTNQPPQLQNWALEGAGNYTRPEFQRERDLSPKRQHTAYSTPIFRSITHIFVDRSFTKLKTVHYGAI